MDYGRIFQRGIAIVWEHKFLWILGFLAALGGSSASATGNANFNTNFNFPIGDGSSTGTDFDESEFEAEAEAFFRGIFGESFSFDQDWEAILPTIFTVIGVIFFIFLIIWLVLYFIRIIAEGGMIRAVYDLEYGGVKTSFGEAFQAGRQTMMPIFVSRLILASPVLILAFILFIFMAIVGFSANSTPGGLRPEAMFAILPAFFGIFFCLFCLVVPYNIIISILYPIAQRKIVFEAEQPWQSLQSAYQLVRNELTPILIWSFLFAAIGTIIGLITAALSVPIVLAGATPAIFSVIRGDFPGSGQIIAAILATIAAVIVGAIINSFVVAARSAMFTMVYQELTAPAEKSLDIDA